ncbi:MAG: hypothetical protein OEZ06_09560 [Myxococcales bacterium]|nr:hypothetical protein [Myxococcales bacterium]
MAHKGQAQPPGLGLAGPRELLLPASVSLAFVLYYLAQLPFYVVAAVVAPTLVLYVAAPAWAAHSVERFDRDVVRLLASGRRQALPARYREALGMRLFAVPGVAAERRALVAAETGQHGRARDHYRRALHQYAGKAPLRVLLGYAHASYEVGDDGEAIGAFRRLLESTGELPGVQRKLAHSLLRRGSDLEQALGLVERLAGPDRAEREADELTLLEALAHARLGDLERAAGLRERAEAVEGELAERLRAELAEALDGQ